MKKINYYVFDGVGEWFCVGGTPTLIGAKRLANRRAGERDPWNRAPAIYRADDTIEVESRGAITTPDGWICRIPRPGAIPVWENGYTIEEV